MISNILRSSGRKHQGKKGQHFFSPFRNWLKGSETEFCYAEIKVPSPGSICSRKSCAGRIGAAHSQINLTTFPKNRGSSRCGIWGIKIDPTHDSVMPTSKVSNDHRSY